MNLIILTKYGNKAPSSRYRFYNYLKYFENEKLNYSIHPFFSDKYVEDLFNSKKRSLILVAKSYFLRFFLILGILFTKPKTILIQGEIFPYIPSYFERLLVFMGHSIFIDLDDAIYLNYNNTFFFRLFKNKFPKILKISKGVIVGGKGLYDYAKKHSNNIIIIPTSIDTELYKKFRNNSETLNVIGWIGSPSSEKDLEFIYPQLTRFLNDFDVTLLLIGNIESMRSKFIANHKVKLIEWNIKTELLELSKIDLGIMPLPDDLYNNGKCSFKLIQYMALSKPTLSTPLTSNIWVDKENLNYFSNLENDNWYESLKLIYLSKDFKMRGLKNGSIADSFFDVSLNAKKTISFLSI
ncbi:MAG: hypothetical protein HQ480_02530 [Candidatus Pelagibacter sp.]|nr:hypothetical protein [Candidatus Pelagibacter sp.]